MSRSIFSSFLLVSIVACKPALMPYSQVRMAVIPDEIEGVGKLTVLMFEKEKFTDYLADKEIGKASSEFVIGEDVQVFNTKSYIFIGFVLDETGNQLVAKTRLGSDECGAFELGQGTTDAEVKLSLCRTSDGSVTSTGPKEDRTARVTASIFGEVKYKAKIPTALFIAMPNNQVSLNKPICTISSGSEITIKGAIEASGRAQPMAFNGTSHKFFDVKIIGGVCAGKAGLLTADHFAKTN